MKQLNTYITEALIKKNTVLVNNSSYYIIIPYSIYSILSQKIGNDNQHRYRSNGTDFWIVSFNELLNIKDILLKEEENSSKNDEPFLIYKILGKFDKNIKKIILKNIDNFKFPNICHHSEKDFIKYFPKIENINKL